jgi:hypothetical protein
MADLQATPHRLSVVWLSLRYFDLLVSVAALGSFLYAMVAQYQLGGLGYLGLGFAIAVDIAFILGRGHVNTFERAPLYTIFAEFLIVVVFGFMWYGNIISAYCRSPAFEYVNPDIWTS